jgi:ABC-2 type transport system ATP-binding protein
VLLSSHDLSEVAAVCERAAILRKGRLIELASISDIVQQGERRLKVWLVKGTEVPRLPIDGLPGVRIIQQNDISLHLAYHGTADAVLKWLARFHIDRIATPETSLEEAFIHYYQKEAGHER